MSKKQSNRPKISIISAVAENRAIGKNNKLLFQIPEDLKYFRTVTQGHPVIMGERTFYSIGRALPNRKNIILSKNTELQIEGCVVVHSLDQAIKEANKDEDSEIFFIGGGMIYSQAIEFADRLYITLIHANPEADTFFPDYSDFKKEISREPSHFENLEIEYLVLERE